MSNERANQMNVRDISESKLIIGETVTDATWYWSDKHRHMRIDSIAFSNGLRLRFEADNGKVCVALERDEVDRLLEIVSESPEKRARLVRKLGYI